jgi:hypothetical protein
VSETEQELSARLNRETAKIPWAELQRFYARGELIRVDKSMDLIQVACQISLDNKEALQQWMEQGLVVRATDDHAKDWHEQQPDLWAVVVAPWVLTQEITSKQDKEAH